MAASVALGCCFYYYFPHPPSPLPPQTHESCNLSHLWGVSFLYFRLEYRHFGLFEAFLVDLEGKIKRENLWTDKADNEYQK